MKLDFYRKKKGLTQEALGKLLGNLSKQTISGWESGRQPIPIEYFDKLLDTLNIPVEDLAPYVSEVNKDALLQIFKDKNDGLEELQKNLPKTPDTIRNTPELRECIKDAMIKQGIRGAAELTHLLGYDSIHSVERLLEGKLNFFPDMLSALLDALNIKYDDAPITPTEREMLYPEGFYNDGGVLVRPIPIIEWANAKSYIESLQSDGSVLYKWDPETTETVPAPVGTRKGTHAYRVHGVSMEPGIMDGDVIFCEPKTSLSEIGDKRVVLVKFIEDSPHSGMPVCKRFRRMGDKILLTSDNPAGEEFTITPQEISFIALVVSKNSAIR